PESLGYVTRRRGRWDQSESDFNEAERLDPRNVGLLDQHALSYMYLRRCPEALRKLDQVLNITPDDVDILAVKAAIAQAEGDLPRAVALLAPLRPAADLFQALETQVYQAILERRLGQIIPRLTEILAKPDPALGYFNGELRFYLGWAQEVAGDHAAAHEGWRQAGANPIAPSPLYRNYSRYRAQGRWLKTCRSLQRCSGSIQCSLRCAATRALRSLHIRTGNKVGRLTSIASKFQSVIS